MANINTQNNRNYNPQITEKEERMLENETRMMRNVFIMRSKILSIQVKVAADKIRSLLSLEGIIDTTFDTEKYREKAENAYSENNYEDSDMYILEAERLYRITSAKLFPAKPKENEKPCDEYLKMQGDRTSSNYTGVTVRGDMFDVDKCIKNAKKAFAENKLEKAIEWLTKSQSIHSTVNAQDLLDEVRAAIAARDAPTETQIMNPEAGQDSVDTNIIFDVNPEQTAARTRSPTEPLLGPTVQYDNVEGAKTCIDRANDASKAGKFDEAENLFLKAKKMNPCIDVEQYLKNLSYARALVYEANTYLTVAENAFNDKNYERALTFLDKSEALNPSERAVKLRKQVEQYLKDWHDARAQTKLNMDEANMYLTVAKNAFNDKNYERTLTFLDKSEAVNPSERAVKLRKQVEQYLKDLHDARAQTKLNMDEANMYLTVAENAFNDKNYERALTFLDKSEALNPSERAVKLRKQVQEAMSSLSTSMGTENKEYEKPTNESDLTATANEYTDWAQDEEELNKREIPYVTELTEKINTEQAINRRCWYQKILDYILEKLSFVL